MFRRIPFVIGIKKLNKVNKVGLNYRLFDFEEIERLSKKIHSDVPKENRYKILKSDVQTNYSVIELFAGAGGVALGFENAGLNHILLNEIDKDACNTLRHNFPQGTNIIHDDVKT